MCLVERYTFRRGRSAVPATFTRMRLWTLRRLSFFEICGIINCLLSLISLPGHMHGVKIEASDKSFSFFVSSFSIKTRNEQLETRNGYFAPVLPTFFFKRSPK